MHTLSHWLDRGARWLAMAALFALPWQGLRGEPLSIAGSLLTFDILVALAVGLGLPALWRNRAQLISGAAAWQVMSVAVAGLLSEALLGGHGLARRLAEQAAPFAAVLVLAWAASEARARALERAALWGGGLALGLSVVGWVMDRASGLHWFSDPAPHHVFAGLPRLFGTLGGSPQRCGSYAVYWLALLLALPAVSDPRMRRWRAFGLALGGCALLLSMSYAWLGGAVLAVSRVAARWRAVTLVMILLAVGAASIPIHIGPASPALSGSCTELDAQHLLAVLTGRGQCQRLSFSGRARTPYWEAKRVSWQALREHPWTGVGYAGFAEYARRAFRQEYGAPGIHYTQPHGVFHGLPAKHGLLGLFALVVWIAALARGWRGSSWDWGIVAFLLIGLHIDVDRLRELWVLWGLQLAEQLRAAAAHPADGGRPRARLAADNRESLVSLSAAPYGR